MLAIRPRRIGKRPEPEHLTISEQRAEREFPPARPGQVKSGDWVGRRQHNAAANEAANRPKMTTKTSRRCKLEQRQQKDRPDEIELLLNAERPQMQERLHRRVGPEIAADAGEAHEPEIHGEVRIAEQAAADLAELGRRSHEPSDDPDETHHHEKRGEDALGPPGVKHREREPPGGALRENDSRNEKARDDKEDVDADEASGKPGAIGMEDDHAEHRERAQSVDVGSEIERRRSARRDQVRRFEGFVQHAGSVGGRQSPTVRPRRRKSLGRDRQAAATSLAWSAAETILPRT